MNVPALVAAVVTAGLVVVPAAEAAKRKPMSGSYDVQLPVPFPAESASGSHCADAPDGLSRNMKTLTLPSSGKLKVALSEYAGDWVIELFDARGTLLSSAAGNGAPVDAEATLTYRKKSRASQKLTVGICNFAGGPDGHVAWTFTFD